MNPPMDSTFGPLPAEYIPSSPLSPWRTSLGLTTTDFDFGDDPYYYEDLYENGEEEDGSDEESPNTSRDNLASSSLSTLGDAVSNPEGVKKRKRHRKPNKKYPVAPRVLRHDIRRQYARMYVNVMNGADPNLMYSFFKRYGAHSPVMKNRVSRQNDTMKTTPFLMEIQGRDVITWFIAAIQQLFPDKAVTYDNVTIRTTHGSMRSTIECNFNVNHTILYDVVVDDFLQEMMSLLAISDASPESAAASTSDTADSAQTSKDSDSDANVTVPAEKMSRRNLLDVIDPLKVPRLRNGYLPLVASPINVQVEGKLILHIDEHNRIDEVEFIGDSG